MKRKKGIPMPLVVLCLGFGVLLGRIRCKWRSRSRKRDAQEPGQ